MELSLPSLWRKRKPVPAGFVDIEDWVVEPENASTHLSGVVLWRARTIVGYGQTTAVVYK